MSLMKSSWGLVFQIIVACCLLPTSSALAVEDGAIVERKAYRFPSYEQAVQTTDVEKYTDKVTYEVAVNDTRFEFQKLTFQAPICGLSAKQTVTPTNNTANVSRITIRFISPPH